MARPRGYAGRARQSARGAGGKQAGVSELVPAEVVRRCLRQKWQTAAQWPAMSEDGDEGLLERLTRKAGRVRPTGLLRRLGLHWHKEGISLGSTAGWPDLPIWGPGGFIVRELKGSDGVVKVTQLEAVEGLRRAGVDAGFWWPEDWYDGTIEDELTALTERRPGVVALPPLAPELTPLALLMAEPSPPAPAARVVTESLPAAEARRRNAGPVWTPGRRACGCPMEGEHVDECPRYGKGAGAEPRR